MLPVVVFKEVAGVSRVLPQGSAPSNPADNPYLTYLDLPGRVEGAFDRRGPYRTSFQVDVYARATAEKPDAAALALETANRFVTHLPRAWSVEGMPRLVGGLDAQDFARCSCTVAVTQTHRRETP